MKKNLQEGFTLIELLVVVAIIGVLASVVLASLNTARAKGSDAAIKANLANTRAQAEIFYDTNIAAALTYTNVCTNGLIGGVNGIGAGIQAASTASGTGVPINVLATAQLITTANCHENVSVWAASVKLKATGYYCVDSTGAALSTATPLIASGTVCL